MIDSFNPDSRRDAIALVKAVWEEDDEGVAEILDNWVKPHERVGPGSLIAGLLTVIDGLLEDIAEETTLDVTELLESKCLLQAAFEDSA